VYASADGSQVQRRVQGSGDKSRHFHLLGVDAQDGALVAVGLAQAPLTHSGDGGNSAAMTFGGLTVRLAP
jgi:hypothetical protein